MVRLIDLNLENLRYIGLLLLFTFISFEPVNTTDTSFIYIPDTTHSPIEIIPIKEAPRWRRQISNPPSPSTPQPTIPTGNKAKLGEDKKKWSLSTSALDTKPSYVYPAKVIAEKDAETNQTSPLFSKTELSTEATANVSHSTITNSNTNITQPSNSSYEDEDELPEEPTNNTLSNNHIKKTKLDSHKYYNSTVIDSDQALAMSYWVDLINATDVQVNPMLSKSHRRAATVRLSFPFPFYGHTVQNVTVATGGFLYTGNFVHSWLAATQYIAPLMANFDTSIDENSFVKYRDNGTAFTVQWERVRLQDLRSAGPFTFQATLHSNGDITFVYKQVPIVVRSIKDDHHPVKIGVSDAYIIDRTIFYVRRKTIYEYHRVEFQNHDIKNWTVILLKALPTCLSYKDCFSCLEDSKGNDFQCSWCPSVKRCSSGTDRHRQEWLVKECDKTSLEHKEQCAHPTMTDSSSSMNSEHYHLAESDDIAKTLEMQHESRTNSENTPVPQSSRMAGSPRVQPIPETRIAFGVAGILSIIFLMTLIFGSAGWLFYAFRNPHTSSGQLLIKYRPSQWSWRRGEARYTAATIHM